MLTGETYAYALGLMKQIERDEKEERIPVLLINNLVVLTAQNIGMSGESWIINAVDEARPLIQQVLIGKFEGPLVIELRPKKDHKEICGFNSVCLVKQATEEQKKLEE